MRPGARWATIVAGAAAAAGATPAWGGQALPTGDLIAKGRYIFAKRRPNGSQDLAKFLAGGPGPEGTTPSNITPHPITGIGRWTEEQIARSIRTGERPNAAPVETLMRAVIQGTSVGYKDMTPADALAISRYLKTIPAIDNRVR